MGEMFEEGGVFKKIWRVIILCLLVFCPDLIIYRSVFCRACRKNLQDQLQKPQKLKFFEILKHPNELKSYCIYEGCPKIIENYQIDRLNIQVH